MVPVAETPRPRGLVLAFAVVFALAAAVAFVLTRRTGLVVFAALTGLTVWVTVVAVANALPRLPFKLRGLFCTFGVIITAAIPLSFYHVRGVQFTGAPDSWLQLAAVLLAILAFGFHFLATYGQHVGRETPAAILGAIVP